MSVRSTRRTRGLREESRPRVTEAPKSSGQAPGPERSRLLLVRVLASGSKTRTRATAMAAVDDLLVIRVRDQTTVCDSRRGPQGAARLIHRADTWGPTPHAAAVDRVG